MTMLPLLDSKKRLFVATEDEALIARETVARVQHIVEAKTDVTLEIADKAGVAVTLPARVVGLIDDFLVALADRKPISIVPQVDELTTQQAADFLKVSRSHLSGLLRKGEIPHRMLGTQCRILMSDLVAYKHRCDEARKGAIAKVLEDAPRLALP
jgi:excisionase family DNA binding protein